MIVILWKTSTFILIYFLSRLTNYMLDEFNKSRKTNDDGATSRCLIFSVCGIAGCLFGIQILFLL